MLYFTNYFTLVNHVSKVQESDNQKKNGTFWCYSRVDPWSGQLLQSNAQPASGITTFQTNL